jgi:hypothetical protein
MPGNVILVYRLCQASSEYLYGFVVHALTLQRPSFLEKILTGKTAAT